MNYSDFWDISSYMNFINRYIFTQKEVAENAYDYLCEFERSKANEEPTHAIKELAKLLAEDGSEECKQWLYQIAYELGLIDMDYADYLETDEWLGDFL